MEVFEVVTLVLVEVETRSGGSIPLLVHGSSTSWLEPNYTVSVNVPPKHCRYRSPLAIVR
jgi:hypothetical protein